MAPSPDPDVLRRIIAAAQAEIEARGVIGLRVATVAEHADTTVSMIYRHFVDRDGLLDAAMTTYYADHVDRVLGAARALLERPGPITLDDVLAATPLPNYETAEARHRFVNRILVVASENTSLRVRVGRLVTDGLEEFAVLMERIVERMEPGERFDPRIYTHYVVQHSWLVNDLRDRGRIDNDEYLAFLRHLCTHVPPPEG